MKLTLEEGKLLVRSARLQVEKKMKRGEGPPLETLKGKFKEKRGVFTTIETYPEKRLRGCIGFPYPVYPLWKALLQSAEEAAFEDPRFPSLSEEELKEVVFEVTVLSTPERILVKHPFELLSNFKVGIHGLMVKGHGCSGLLLPQVAVENEWSEEEFISHTCMKAGLPLDEWKKGELEFFRFSSQIFSEVSPEGEIVERKLLEGAEET